MLTATLAALVGYQIRKLWLERKAAQFGSQLKLRLVAMFAMMAIVPGVLIYAVSLQFAIKSIDSWFDVRVDNALESAIALGRGSSTTCSTSSRPRPRRSPRASPTATSSVRYASTVCASRSAPTPR